MDTGNLNITFDAENRSPLKELHLHYNVSDDISISPNKNLLDMDGTMLQNSILNPDDLFSDVTNNLGENACENQENRRPRDSVIGKFDPILQKEQEDVKSFESCGDETKCLINSSDFEIDLIPDQIIPVNNESNGQFVNSIVKDLVENALEQSGPKALLNDSTVAQCVQGTRLFVSKENTSLKPFDDSNTSTCSEISASNNTVIYNTSLTNTSPCKQSTTVEIEQNSTLNDSVSSAAPAVNTSAELIESEVFKESKPLNVIDQFKLKENLNGERKSSDLNDSFLNSFSNKLLISSPATDKRDTKSEVIEQNKNLIEANQVPVELANEAEENLNTTFENIRTVNQDLNQTNEILRTVSPVLNQTNENICTVNQDLNQTNEVLRTVSPVLNQTNEILHTVSPVLDQTNENICTVSPILNKTNENFAVSQDLNTTNENLRIVSQILNATNENLRAVSQDLDKTNENIVQIVSDTGSNQISVDSIDEFNRTATVPSEYISSELTDSLEVVNETFDSGVPCEINETVNNSSSEISESQSKNTSFVLNNTDIIVKDISHPEVRINSLNETVSQPDILVSDQVDQTIVVDFGVKEISSPIRESSDLPEKFVDTEVKNPSPTVIQQILNQTEEIIHMSEATSNQSATDVCEPAISNRLSVETSATATNEMGEVINQNDFYDKQTDITNGSGDSKSLPVDNKESIEARAQMISEMTERLVVVEAECEKYKVQVVDLKKELKTCRQKTVTLESEVADLKRRENELNVLIEQYKTAKPVSVATDSKESGDEVKTLRLSETALKNEVKDLQVLVKQLENNLRDIQKKEAKLVDDLNNKTQSEMQISRVMEEYEKSISSLVAENEKMKKERDTAQMHLNNIELAFSDVHQKYERCKTIVQGYKDNEESFKQDIAMNRETIVIQEQKYETLKAHAMAQLEKSNQELAGMKKQHDMEISRLTAQLKRYEIKNISLMESLQQKAKECEQLSAVCDEFIGNV